MRELQKHYQELDYFNACACILVILIHVLSLGISTLQPNSWQMIIIYFPWRLSAFVVPAFFFCGAVKLELLFTNGETFYYRHYILRRITKIYVPYLVANLIYYVVFLSISYVKGDSIRELLEYIMVGNLSAPFYYVVIVMQFYLLAPLWKVLTQKMPWYIGLLTSLFFTFVFAKLSSAFALLGINFQYINRLFLTYLWFWAAGLYAGKYYEHITISLQKLRWSICLYLAAICIFFAVLSYLQFSFDQYIYDLNVLKIFSDSIAIVLLLRLCMYVQSFQQKRLQRIMKAIHSASYFVYLYHCLFLTLCTACLQSHGITKMSILILSRAAVCYMIPFSLFHLYECFLNKIKQSMKICTSK